MGDIHGDYAPIRGFYKQNKNLLFKNYKENILILLGDAGINYFLNYRDENFKNKLEEYPFTYFCIRGNHELRPSELMERWPSDWHKERFFGNIVYTEDRHPKILYALDNGGEYFIENKSVLIVPGAYSVDKFFRIANHWTWNPTEQLNEDEKNKILNNLKPKYDFILSHTCPFSWQSYIQDLFLPQVKQSEVDNSMELFLDKIAAGVEYDRWYWGHYHDDRDISAINGTMLFHQAIPFGESISSYQMNYSIF